MRNTTGVMMLALLAMTAGARPESMPADDDLAVVRKAVSGSAAAASAAPERVAPDALEHPREVAPPAVETKPARPRRSGEVAARGRRAVVRVDQAEGPSEPRWLRIRVSERDGERVVVNVPLWFSRDVSDDSPERACVRRGREDCTSFSDVLRTLRTGQDLVTILDHEALVRVWVD